MAGRGGGVISYREDGGTVSGEKGTDPVQSPEGAARATEGGSSLPRRPQRRKRKEEEEGLYLEKNRRSTTPGQGTSAVTGEGKKG